MRILLNIIFLAFILYSCDKQKHTAKKLDGEWEISTYKLTDPEGLNEYATCSGSIVFDSKPNYLDPQPYTLEISYTFPSTSGSRIQHGTFDVIERGDYMIITEIDNSELEISKYTYRILTRTRTDLQLEYTDSLNFIHTYLFTKKK